MRNHFEYKSGYSDTESVEKLFPLFEQVFDLKVETLKDFYDRGFWDSTYRPFTYFDKERAVANVSMFSLDLIIENECKTVAGIQSVMTHPDYRKRGLMTELMHKMLNEIDNEFEFSLLMTDSPDLYKPFGFRVLREHYFTASYMHEPGINTNVKKLDFSNEDDFQRITDIFHNKVRLSQYFAPISYWESFAYSSYYHEKLYLVEELDTVIVFEVKEDTLKLYDVVSAKLPILEDICTHIPYPFTKIELYFSPDQFTTIPLEPVLVNSQDCLMVRGPFSMEKGYFKFPITANF